MIVDHMSPDYHILKARLYEVVAVRKFSSLEMICEQAGIDEDSTRELLQELVKDGSIDGSFSEDGRRFYLSNAKISDAPVIMRNDEVLEIKKESSKKVKTVGLLGFFTVILGLVFRGLTVIHQGMENVGVALLMIGLVVMTAGCIQFSRINPPEKLR